MQRLVILIGALALALAAGASFLGANLMANFIEQSSVLTVKKVLDQDGYDWASVRADGLIINVSGPAPSEVDRFKALSAVKTVVNAARVRDAIKIADPNDLPPPIFSLELLRNDDGISLIGLIPTETGRDTVLEKIKTSSKNAKITDMLETADYDKPQNWDNALNFALNSLALLPRSKISVTPEKITIAAITDSQDEKSAIEATLLKGQPKGINLILKISAPRPVITPFSLRLVKDKTGARFDSCSADTVATRKAILKAARAIGVPVGADCAIGLGAPSPRWGKAVVEALGAVNDLKGGELTFSDADITLIAPTGTRQGDFDRITYNLEQALPDVFSLHAVLPPKLVVEGAAPKAEIPEFLVTKSPEGLVQMRGRLRNARTKVSVRNFATALFQGKNVHDTTRIDPNLPDQWPARVLAGLEALSQLHNGLLTIHPDMVDLRGVADRPDAKTKVTQIFSQRLAGISRYQINVTYEPALNRQKVMPTPQECVDAINNILKQQQITFEPSSAKINGNSMMVMEKIAEKMTDCTGVRMEIDGFTDSQGRETMNLTLSQSRAETVLDTLLSLDVLTNNLSAKGFGEANPIADNKTEEGRKANRRIEFHLVKDAPKTAAKPPENAAATETPSPADHSPQKKTSEKTNGKN